MTGLPIEVVETDHNLESIVDKGSEALAHHRWHWTLDESNPARVSMNAYAVQIGKPQSAVRRYATGYDEWINAQDGSALINIIERQQMSTDKEVAVQAVSDATSTSFGYARKVLAPDVSRVRDALDAAVERQPDMTADDKAAHAAKVAERIANERVHEKAQRTEHKASKSSGYILVVGDVERARRALLSAIDNARGIEWGDTDEAAGLAERFGAVVALGELGRAAVAGTSGVDWDAEMTKLGAL